MTDHNGAHGLTTDFGLTARAFDLPGIRDIGLPCYAAAVTPNSPAKNGPGTAGLPIVLAGVAVGPSDIVVGDEDGVVVVPHAEIAATIESLEAVRAAEATLLAKVQGGLTVPDNIKAMAASGRFIEVA